MTTFKSNISTVLLGLFCFSGCHADQYLVKTSQDNHTLNAFKSNSDDDLSTETPQSVNTSKSNAVKTELTYQIVSPYQNEHIHNFNPLIPIKTSPTLKKSDDIDTVINGKPTKAIYENNTWNIKRPNPGKNVISLKGKTMENKKISSNSVTIYIHNNRVTN